MAYKDLLVHVDDTRSCAARLQAAVDLAAAHEAHLTGVYIIADPSPAVFATNTCKAGFALLRKILLGEGWSSTRAWRRASRSS